MSVSGKFFVLPACKLLYLGLHRPKRRAPQLVFDGLYSYSILNLRDDTITSFVNETGADQSDTVRSVFCLLVKKL